MENFDLAGYYICEIINAQEFIVYDQSFATKPIANEEMGKYIEKEGFVLQGIEIGFVTAIITIKGPIHKDPLHKVIENKIEAGGVNLNDMHKAWGGETREKIVLDRSRNQKKNIK